MCMEEKNFYDPIVLCGEKMRFFHISGNDRGVPPEGVINWEAIFKAFKDIGFDGYVGFETFCPGNSTVFRPFAEWGEKFAVDSLKFTLEQMEKYGFKRG